MYCKSAKDQTAADGLTTAAVNSAFDLPDFSGLFLTLIIVYKEKRK
jgi:hypothetical protein